MSTLLLLFGCGVGMYWLVRRGQRFAGWPAILRFTPLLSAAVILLLYFLTERGLLEFSRTEHSYGIFVLLLLPLSFLLLLFQLFIWWRVRAERDADVGASRR